MEKSKISQNPQLLKKEIIRLSKEYSKLVHREFLPANHPRRKNWV